MTERFAISAFVATLVLVAVLFRYDIEAVDLAGGALLLDRWTGEMQFCAERVPCAPLR